MVIPPSSRYYGSETAQLERPDGSTVVYLRRRFLPPPERFVTVQEHVVSERDRLDNISMRYLGDPEQASRICDANRAMRPEALTERTGRRLRITLPDGVPGVPFA